MDKPKPKAREGRRAVKREESDGLIRASLFLEPAVHEALRMHAAVLNVSMAHVANGILKESLSKAKRK